MFKTPFQVCFPEDTTGTAIHRIMKYLILKLFFNSKNILENRRMKIILASDLSAAKQGVEITNQFSQTFKDNRLCGYTIHSFIFKLHGTKKKMIHIHF